MGKVGVCVGVRCVEEGSTTRRGRKFTVVSGVRVSVRISDVLRIDIRLVGRRKLHSRKGCDSNRPGVRRGASTS